MTGRFPRQFGKYVLLKPLAKGGMGEIYLAAGGEVGGFEKLCVIKKVITEKADRNKANRFQDEAKVVLRLSHSALVNTFDAGEVNGEFYIAMELVEGKDLREVWNRCVRVRQRIPLDVALHVVREVARALAYVHGYGNLKLVHRDVAPPNILLSYVGDVKLTDFGLARSILKQEHTVPGVVFGRAAYLAPEQARGEIADARTDIYTLGIVLWELLTGQQFLQLSGLDPAAALAIVRHPKVAAPSSRAPWITPALDQVAMRALAPDRERRFQSAEELRQALTAVIAEIAPTADSSRVAEFLQGIYAETIAEERSERERFLKDEIPGFRASAPPRGGRGGGGEGEGGGEPEEPPTSPGGASQAAPVEEGPRAPSRPRARRSSAPRLPGMPAPSGRREAGRERHDGAAEPSKVPPAALTSPDPTTEGVHPDLALIGRGPRRTDRPPPSAPGYRGGRPLAQSEIGNLVAAEQTATGNAAALRVYARSVTHDASEPWRRELFAASALRHPHIVEVREAGLTPDGRPFAALEPLAGSDLTTLLARDQRLEPLAALRIAHALVGGLAAAHGRGLVHRTLCPGSVMVIGATSSAPGAVKILDFGLHLLLGQGPGKGRVAPGLPAGLVEYAAPEQLRGNPARVDVRADLYSVGAILYEMVTGVPPFAGPPRVVERKKRTPPQSPRMFRPDLPAELEALLTSLLSPDPAQRPATAEALEKRLQALLPSSPGSDPGSAPHDELDRRRARRDLAFRAIAELVSGVAAGLAPPAATVGGSALSLPFASPVPPTPAGKEGDTHAARHLSAGKEGDTHAARHLSAGKEGDTHAARHLSAGKEGDAHAARHLSAGKEGDTHAARHLSAAPGGGSPVLGGGLLTRYGLGPEAEADRRKGRAFRTLAVAAVALGLLALGLAKVFRGGPAPAPPVSPGRAASP